MHLPHLLACFVAVRNFVLGRCYEVYDRHTGGLQDTARRNSGSRAVEEQEEPSCGFRGLRHLPFFPHNFQTISHYLDDTSAPLTIHRPNQTECLTLSTSPGSVIILSAKTVRNVGCPCITSKDMASMSVWGQRVMELTTLSSAGIAICVEAAARCILA